MDYTSTFFSFLEQEYSEIVVAIASVYPLAENVPVPDSDIHILISAVPEKFQFKNLSVDLKYSADNHLYTYQEERGNSFVCSICTSFDSLRKFYRKLAEKVRFAVKQVFSPVSGRSINIVNCQFVL